MRTCHVAFTVLIAGVDVPVSDTGEFLDWAQYDTETQTAEPIHNYEFDDLGVGNDDHSVLFSVAKLPGDLLSINAIEWDSDANEYGPYEPFHNKMLQTRAVLTHENAPTYAYWLVEDALDKLSSFDIEHDSSIYNGDNLHFVRRIVALCNCEPISDSYARYGVTDEATTTA